MSTHEQIPRLSGFPLEAHVAELLRRREAITSLQGGATYFGEDIGLFRNYAQETQLILPRKPAEIAGPPSDEGNEHQVWFVEDRASFVKATWPGNFGLKVLHRSDEDSKASPIDYLERWHLHNLIFDDQVSLLGAFDTPEGLRIVIEQRAIKGEPATEEQIREFFETSGWRPFMSGGELAFFDPVERLVISDTHRGNIILMEDGLFAPIDLRIQRLGAALLDTVIKLSS
jgi:hypothetical protein